MRAGWIAALILVTALAACREEEQDRLLSHEPGVYRGGAMPALTDENRATLQERAQNQNF